MSYWLLALRVRWALWRMRRKLRVLEADFNKHNNVVSNDPTTPP